MTLIEAGNLEPAESPAARRTFQAGSTAVDLLTTEYLLHAVEKAIAGASKWCVIFCNVSTVVSCRHDAALRNAVDCAEVVSPDGMPLVWLARLRGHRIERVDGPSFMKAAMGNGVRQGWRHYLYGGSPQVLARLIENLERELPGVQICGACSPPFRDLTEIEETASVDEINSAAPDLVWVGLGMPKQELWMARNRDRIGAPVLLGVGAAFDFHAGVKKRAPKWMQQRGLEWLHRLVHEPRRLGGRYVAGNARFLMLVTREELQRRLADMREAR
jgi:N-acetylglucosaminyldiphosphoundecaprenol N-acetyl-beta-D-mannosaminyltransferase